MIIPGNGNTDISENWFPFVRSELQKLGLEVIAENMPDPELARMQIWVLFIRKRINTGDSILIGHSSGAVAALRYLEQNVAKLVILIGVYYTDLGDIQEKKSGHFEEPWKWSKIKEASEKFVIFASRDDPFIPISEPRYIRDMC